MFNRRTDPRRQRAARRRHRRHQRLRARLEGEISRADLRGRSRRERLGRIDRFAPFLSLPLQGTRRPREAPRRQGLRRRHRGPARRQHPHRLLRLRPRIARARMTGVKTELFAIDVSGNGSKGYYSVFYVKADSPYQKIEDLKGKNLGLVDPNSTSGNNVPRFVAGQRRASTRTRSSARSSTPAATRTRSWRWRRAQVDVAANRWNSDDDSTLPQMLDQGHAEERRRFADEEGRLPHHLQVRRDRERPLRLSRPTCRPI